MSEQEKLEKRMEQLEKELIFTQESLRSSTKTCARQFENMQRYVKGLREIADFDSPESAARYLQDVARKALEGASS